MDISLESAAEEKPVRITSDQKVVFQNEHWDEIRFKVECYLRAWRFRDPCLSEGLVAPVLQAVQSRLSAEPGLNSMKIAIEEADRCIGERLSEILGGTLDQGALSVQQCLAVALAKLPEKWGTELRDPASASAAFQQATINFQLSKRPQRPMESLPTRMRTSLSRLPSVRLIGGWCLVIILLVLIFIFTH